MVGEGIVRFAGRMLLSISLSVVLKGLHSVSQYTLALLPVTKSTYRLSLEIDDLGWNKPVKHACSTPEN